jgi:glycine/D-amino acid oxidase-like deaminating enzyme
MLEARNTCFGATGRNGGHCRPHIYQAGYFGDYCSTWGVDETLKRTRFELMNLDLLREYVRSEAVDCEFVETGSTDIYYDKAHFEIAKRDILALEEVAPDLARLVGVVDAETAEGREMLKDVLRTPTAAGAITFRAAKLWPYKLVSHILAKGVREQGLNLQTTTPALSVLRVGKKWAIETPRGVVVADRVVFATNAHTAHLLPALGGWIYPVRAQMAALIPPENLRERPLSYTYGLMHEDRKNPDYLIQRPFADDGSGGELMLGGGRRLEVNRGVGMNDEEISPRVSEHLRRAIPEYFADESGYANRENTESRPARPAHDIWDAAEGLGFIENTDDFVPVSKTPELRAVAEWSGTMGFSRDECPFVGKVPPVGPEDSEERGIPMLEDTSGLWMLAGFDGHGMIRFLGEARNLLMMAGMAFTSGSAKALALMIEADEKGVDGVDGAWRDWFPRTFQVTPQRIGLRGVEPEGEWVSVEHGDQ